MFSRDKTIFASNIGIKDETELQLLCNKANWFYNVCEALEYTDIVGKRLAQISCGINNDFLNKISNNISIEANSILLMVLNLSASFFDLFFFPYTKNRKVSCPQDKINFQWEITVPFKNPTAKLLNGLRNALVHRHPINMRNMRFLGNSNRLGIALSPIEFNRYIHLSPKIIAEPKTRKQIKFVREEPFSTEFGFLADWFAWDNGTTLCFLDCEDLGNGISDYLFNLLSDIVKRNDVNIKDLLLLLRKFGSRSVYLPAIRTSYYVGAYHVTEPFINRLI
jgi:hypothetical protein